MQQTAVDLRPIAMTIDETRLAVQLRRLLDSPDGYAEQMLARLGAWPECQRELRVSVLRRCRDAGLSPPEGA